MKYLKRVETTEGIFVSVLIIIIISLVMPYYSLIEEMRGILTVATFLFGIFSGFVIASRLSRYSRYRELLTNETGYLITIYQYSKFMGGSFAKKMSELIDEYLVESFLYEVYQFHEKTEEKFYTILELLRNAAPKGEQQEKVLNLMNSMIKDFLKDREELYLLGKDRLAFWLKTTLVILAGVILYSLFLVRTETFYSFNLTVLLSASVVIVLFLIRDLDKLKFSNEAISYGIYYRVFDAIGKPRIYTNESVNRGIKLPKNSQYRFGEIKRKKGKAKYLSIKLVNPR